MFVCAFCSRVKSLTLTRALFARWELNEDDTLDHSTLECHHCFSEAAGITIPTVYVDPEIERRLRAA